jgi:hypothetical protein
MIKLSANADDINRILFAAKIKPRFEVSDIDANIGVTVKLSEYKWLIPGGQLIVWLKCERGRLLIDLNSKLFCISLPEICNKWIGEVLEKISDGILIKGSNDCLLVDTAGLKQKWNIPFSIHFNQVVLKNKFIELDFSIS